MPDGADRRRRIAKQPIHCMFQATSADAQPATISRKTNPHSTRPKLDRPIRVVNLSLVVIKHVISVSLLAPTC